MNVLKDRRYTKDHEWVKEEGDLFIVGISDHAQAELGDVVFVELPDVGATFSKGDTFSNVESVKAVSEVYIPISGEVTETNAALEDAPETVNASPYEDGWMVKVKISDKAEFESLMSSDDYEAMLSEIE